MESITWGIGTAAGLLTTISWLPQVAKSWRTRSAGDFSWGYLAMFAGGVASWEAYGWLRKDPVIIVANLATLLLIFAVMFVKAKEERKVG